MVWDADGMEDRSDEEEQGAEDEGMRENGAGNGKMITRLAGHVEVESGACADLDPCFGCLHVC